MVTVQDLKNREKILADYLVQSQYGADGVWHQEVDAKGGKLNTLSEDDKEKIARTVYKKGKDSYFTFLTVDPTAHFGQGRLAQLYERDSRMSEVDFVDNFTQNMSLNTLGNLFYKMSSNLERTLKPIVFYGVTEQDVPNMKDDLKTESKDRYNVDLDGNKIKTLEDVVGIYSVLGSNPSPENFEEAIKKYIAQRTP